MDDQTYSCEETFYNNVNYNADTHYFFDYLKSSLIENLDLKEVAYSINGILNHPCL